MTPEERKQQSAKNRAVRLEACEERFRQGEAGALLYAVEICGADQPLPKWAAEAFKARYSSVVYHFAHATWDAVFGTPHPSGTKLNAQRRKHKLQLQVFDRVRMLKAKTKKPYEEVFRLVAAEFKIGAPTVKRYYEDTNHFFWPTKPDRQSVQETKR